MVEEGGGGGAWQRNKDGLGLWEHRGKVAVAGVGHSPADRRWDGVNLETSLGAYSILAAQKAMADAGINPDDVDGVITCPGPLGDPWAPRPFFDAPYDTEDGLTIVTAEWLAKGLGLKNVKYFNSKAPQIGPMMGLAAQAVGDGLATVCLVLYPTGNVPGRYHHVGANAQATARGNAQWNNPWGHQLIPQIAFGFDQYCRKYGSNHDAVAPFVINQRRNGLKVPWGYYTLHEPYQLNTEDYLAARWVCEPMRLLDADRPVQASACYVFTTAEKARHMQQKPVYVLNHCQINNSPRSTVETLDETEAWTDKMARVSFEGAGLKSTEIDVFNPYDGFTLFTQYYLEAFQWHGVKRGEAQEFYKGDIRSEGPHPLCPSGGNNGTGRTRTAIFTDCIEQLQGRAGPRQITLKAETALAGCVLPAGCGWAVFGTEATL